MENVSLLRLAAADLIACGIIGTLLDAAIDVLEEYDSVMAIQLQELQDQIMDRFHTAEDKLFELEGMN